MSEEDFVFAWLLAAKSGAGLAVSWQQSTKDAQIKEARSIYKQIKESCNETDSRTED